MGCGTADVLPARWTDQRFTRGHQRAFLHWNECLSAVRGQCGDRDVPGAVVRAKAEDSGFSALTVGSLVERFGHCDPRQQVGRPDVCAAAGCDATFDQLEAGRLSTTPS